MYRGIKRGSFREICWGVIDLDKCDAEEKSCIMEEFKVMKRIKNEPIFSFRDGWTCKKSNTINVISDLLYGRSLRTMVAETSYIMIKVVRRWCTQILSALALLHK